jgi:hypothetical protein
MSLCRSRPPKVGVDSDRYDGASGSVSVGASGSVTSVIVGRGGLGAVVDVGASPKSSVGRRQGS